MTFQSTADCIIEWVHAMILSDRHVTADEVANQSWCNHSQGCHKVLAAWIAATHGEIEVQTFNCLLVPLESLTELMGYLLRWIISRVKTWIHYDDMESKCQNLQCKYLLSQIVGKFKMQPTMRKCCWLIFWVSQGPVLEHQRDKDTAVRITHLCCV
jgi:hypothetical protein